MDETLRELAGDLQMIHQSLEQAEAVERQLGRYWREFEEQLKAATARAEAAEALLRDLAAIINPHEAYDATKILGWARDTVERAREADGAEAYVADLRGALDTLNHAAKVAISTQYGGSFDEDTPLVIRLLDGTCDDTDTALARTPAQSLARAEARVWVEAAEKVSEWAEKLLGYERAAVIGCAANLTEIATSREEAANGR